jgi:FMN phosphatase YigB (HAD superfamily)
MRLRAVFFDVGETLVHVDPSFAELFVRVLADEGHARSVDQVREASAHVYAGFS